MALIRPIECIELRHSSMYRIVADHKVSEYYDEYNKDFYVTCTVAANISGAV